LICNLIKTPPLFFTGHKLLPPGIGIEATVNNQSFEDLGPVCPSPIKSNLISDLLISD